jgi:nitroreductase
MTHPVIDVIERRPSTNLFDRAQTLSDSQISQLVELATRAPTSFNLQNWRFIAVRTPEAKARLHKIAWSQPKVLDAGVTFIICGQLTAHETIADRLQASVDAGIVKAELVEVLVGAARSLYFEQPQSQRDEAIRTATFGAATLILAAEALGLSTGAMIGFEPDAVAREFELKPGEIPVLLLAVGHSAEKSRQKPRRPVSEVLTFA